MPTTDSRVHELEFDSSTDGLDIYLPVLVDDPRSDYDGLPDPDHEDEYGFYVYLKGDGSLLLSPEKGRTVKTTLDAVYKLAKKEAKKQRKLDYSQRTCHLG